MGSLIQKSDDLGEYDRYWFIVQTIGHHLNNYLTYNRRTPDQLSVILSSAKKNYQGGSQKHMEVISLDVLRCLYEKNKQFTLDATAELPLKQVDYIVQIATEYDPPFGRALSSIVNQETLGQTPTTNFNPKRQMGSPRGATGLGSPRQAAGQRAGPPHHSQTVKG